MTGDESNLVGTENLISEGSYRDASNGSVSHFCLIFQFSQVAREEIESWIIFFVPHNDSEMVNETSSHQAFIWLVDDVHSVLKSLLPNLQNQINAN